MKITGFVPLIQPAVAASLITKTLRNTFDEYMERIDQTIQTAVDEGNFAAIGLLSLGEDAFKRIIDHFANVYMESLDNTLDSFSIETRTTLAEMENMLIDFESRNETKLQEMFSQLQQIANTIPCAHLQPQLASTTPRFFVATDIDGDSIVSFKGNFFWAAHQEEDGWFFQGEDYKPRLTFGDKQCSLLHAENDDLDFRFPNAIFGHLPERNCSTATGILSIFWKENGWILTTRREALYHITLIALPIIAGTVRATFRSQRTITERIQKEFSDVVTGAGSSRTFIYKPDAGFLFDLNKIKVAKYPDCYPVISNFQTDSLTFTVHLNTTSRYARFGFGITVDQIRNVVTNQPDVTQTMELRWNKVEILNPKQQIGNGNNLFLSEFTFIDCRNRSSTFLPPYHHGTILRVQTAANGCLMLTAATPVNLNSFMNGD